MRKGEAGSYFWDNFFFSSCHAPSPYCVHVAATHGQKNNNSVGGHACASVCGSVLRTTWRDVEKRREKKSTQTTGINAQRGRHSSVITCLDREIGRLDFFFFFLISSCIHISSQSRIFSYFLFRKGWNFLSWAWAFFSDLIFFFSVWWIYFVSI